MTGHGLLWKSINLNFNEVLKATVLIVMQFSSETKFDPEIS
jgi:hypothetical protein